MSEHHMTIRLRPEQEGAPQSQAPRPHTPKMNKKLFKRIIIVVAVLFLLAGAALGFKAVTNAMFPKQSGDPKDMVANVSKLMVLPDEAPTVAVVSDLEKLKDQRFFAHAQEGDIVLMYPKAQKAVLYSPTRNKIIEVAPITNDTEQL